MHKLVLVVALVLVLDILSPNSPLPTDIEPPYQSPHLPPANCRFLAELQRAAL
jgi:hypothetical protein